MALLEFTSTAKANVLYFAQPINYDQQEVDTIFLYGASGTTGTVTSLSGFSSTFSVGANNVTSVVVPSSYDLTASGVVTNNGFTISTGGNVGASHLSREPFTTDTTYLFDSTGLETSYYAVGATNSVIDHVGGWPRGRGPIQGFPQRRSGRAVFRHWHWQRRHRHQNRVERSNRGVRRQPVRRHPKQFDRMRSHTHGPAVHGPLHHARRHPDHERVIHCA